MYGPGLYFFPVDLSVHSISSPWEHLQYEMSHLVGKPTMWFPSRSDTNQAAQPQKQARSLKFWIQEEEEVYYP